MDLNAIAGAQKICGRGKCFAGYKCGHTNKWTRTVSLVGTETQCPLAKYNVMPEENPKPWYERTRDEVEVSDDEFFALCSHCEHGEIVLEGDIAYVQSKDGHFETACIDCPVHSVLESIYEAAAEAAMS